MPMSWSYPLQTFYGWQTVGSISLIAQAMHYAFIAIWIAALITWVVGVAFFVPVWWSLIRQRKPDRKNVRGSLISAAVFVGLVGAAFGVGGIAELAGGWG